MFLLRSEKLCLVLLTSNQIFISSQLDNAGRRSLTRMARVLHIAEFCWRPESTLTSPAAVVYFIFVIKFADNSQRIYQKSLVQIESSGIKLHTGVTVLTVSWPAVPIATTALPYQIILAAIKLAGCPKLSPIVVRIFHFIQNFCRRILFTRTYG